MRAISRSPRAASGGVRSAPGLLLGASSAAKPGPVHLKTHRPGRVPAGESRRFEPDRANHTLRSWGKWTAPPRPHGQDCLEPDGPHHRTLRLFMASAASHVSFLPPLLTFCGAAVLAVPLFRLMGLSAVLGYLAAGFAIGPSGFRLIEDPETTATVAELGVVLLLFIVGLELKLSHLWEMKRDIFGLGLAQLAVTGLVMGSLGHMTGLSFAGAFVTGVALALSATAIALQMLEERDDL